LETFTMDLQGRTLSLETGKLAKQASGAVRIRYGDTFMLVTATVSDQPRDGVDFLPMTVDYEERLYAVGRIPGGFIKREGRPTEKATLSARLTDRTLRPLFPKGLRNSLHIVSTVLSVDQDCPPEILSIIGASAALSISKIPFGGPVAAVMMGLVDGEPVVNPTLEQSRESKLHLVIAGTKDAVMMVEAEADEVSRDDILRCIQTAHETIKELVAVQEEMVARIGVDKMELPAVASDPELVAKVTPFVREKIAAALRVTEKQQREAHLSEVKQELLEQFAEEYPEREAELKAVYEAETKETMRRMITEERVRPDGRNPEEIRPISCEVSLLPRTHGSALFTRGQTQVLNVCTLGALRDMQILDGLGIEESKKFIHHYNFPPYSVGEAGFMRGAGRREIGHGALAERALSKVAPEEDVFPYTVRLVSEVLESNGSTSMGSVCAGSLSLMDAGVPLKRAVSGIAMGLIKEGDQVAILSDIQGMEDFLGDMDFKVAGTVNGITALQMDIKIQGLSHEILAEALEQAVKGYLFIMDKMNEAISSPRPELSPYAPRMIQMQIEVDKIRDVIGPGGRMINKIISETGVGVDVEPDGRIFIAAVDMEAGKKAREMIEALIMDVEPGKTYLGKVTRVEKYGAFVEVLPGKDGLLHISNMDYNRVEKTEDVANLGDMIEVKVTDIDDKGRINLSRKELMEKPEGYEERPKRREGYSRERREGPPRDRRRS
jgi:polyribonucleotide nucleotidyltransferase